VTATVAEPRSLRDPHEDRCSHCGAVLENDQEWCLHCGSARTLIHSAPDWRVGLAIVGGVVVVAVVVFVLVLSSVSSSGGGPSLAATAATVATHNAPAPGAIPGWPVGLGGWTVSVARTGSRAGALARARRIGADGVQVGVLDSSLHPALRPGHWVVFSGRYPTQSQALAAAAQLRSLGQPHARPLLVGSPA
jgi:hypothetical protein